MTARTPSPASVAAALGGTILDDAGPARDELLADPAAAELADWNRAVYRRGPITVVWTPGAPFPACRARWLLAEIERGQAVQWVAAYPRRRWEPLRPFTAPLPETVAAWAEPCPALPWWWVPPGPAHPGGACDCAAPARVYGSGSVPPPREREAAVPPTPARAQASAPAWTVAGHAVDLRAGVLTVDGRQVAADVDPAAVTVYGRRLYVAGRPVADLAA